MRTPQWKLASEVRTAINTSRTIPSGFFTSLTRRLEATLSSPSSNELEMIRDGLEKILHDVVAQISKDVLTTAGEPELEIPISASYMLGQLSFAHQLTLAASGKVDSIINNEIFSSPKFAPYIVALKENNLSGKQLAESCNLAPETVSRTLAELREHGITDYRREGTSLVNFLTASGKILAERIPSSPHKNVALDSAKNNLMAKTSPEFMAMPIFSNKMLSVA